MLQVRVHRQSLSQLAASNHGQVPENTGKLGSPEPGAQQTVASRHERIILGNLGLLRTESRAKEIIEHPFPPHLAVQSCSVITTTKTLLFSGRSVVKPPLYLMLNHQLFMVKLCQTDGGLPLPSS